MEVGLHVPPGNELQVGNEVEALIGPSYRSDVAICDFELNVDVVPLSICHMGGGGVEVLTPSSELGW
jgi:hypothetical protein